MDGNISVTPSYIQPVTQQTQDIEPMLVQCLWHRPNIDPTLVQCLVFAGKLAQGERNSMLPTKWSTFSPYTAMGVAQPAVGAQ